MSDKLVTEATTYTGVLISP